MSRVRPSGTTVHPHVRRENCGEAGGQTRAPGSSPRAQGKRGRVRQGHAGNPVHPHVRRENCFAKSFDRIGRGSSPRAQGKRGQCAGKWRRRGSSPRAQGKRLTIFSLVGCLRFIPTCAGKTLMNFTQHIITPVHPHVRRENLLDQCERLRDAGSSPRAQGKRRKKTWKIGYDRFIPTCAGKTCTARLQQRYTSVHPHVRRENCAHTVSCAVHEVHPHVRRENERRLGSVMSTTVHPHVRRENVRSAD